MKIPPKIRINRLEEGNIGTGREKAKTFSSNGCVCGITSQALQRNSLRIFKS